MSFSLENWLCQSEPMPEEIRQFVGLENLDKALVVAKFFETSAAPVFVSFCDKTEARNFVDHLKFLVGTEDASRVHYLPHIDFDYYRGVFPNPETLCERNVTLHYAATDPGRRIFVSSLAALLQKAILPDAFIKSTKVMKPNEEFPREELLRDLIQAGYQRQPSALDPGIFAVRGSVVDIFSPLYPHPMRIEFYGDLVDEIRFFDPSNQRSLEKIESASIPPVKYSLLPRGEAFQEAARKIKERLDSQEISKAKREELILSLQDGNLMTEAAYLFPLLSAGSVNMSEYFPKETVFFWDGRAKSIEAATDHELPRIHANYLLFEKEHHPIALEKDLFMESQELKSIIDSDGAHYFEAFGEKEAGEEARLESMPVIMAAAKEAARKPMQLLADLAERIRHWKEEGYRVQLVSHTQTHSEKIQALLSPYHLTCLVHRSSGNIFSEMIESDYHYVHLWQGFVNQSRTYPTLRLVVVTEEDIFGHKKRTRSAPSATDTAKLLSSFKDLKINDYVVHKDFGIGKYLGLKPMVFQEIENDYVVLEYKDGDKLYIPVYRLNVLQKYVGSEGASPTLDKLGGDRWTKAKSKAQKAVAELAEELLKIQAQRKLIPAKNCSALGTEYQEFEMEFPYDETPDQDRAIDEVNHDLSRDYPMDRLICGDVGYGKTEVAMRAAFRVALDGGQVAVLVPTTILAFQHFQNFQNRFKTTGIKVETVSRLRSSTQIKKTLEELKNGKVDILIGTHRLLSSDVEFKNLQLVVIDEEHRFGVVHKEKLKKMTESVHVLTLTATPIPRTLNMSMAGIKDISIMTTPPPDRLSVRTFVCRNSSEVIADAITSELARDGQVFFVHNRIQSIFKLGEELKQLLPKAHFEIVHGQMDPDELEKRMLTFYEGKAHVLLTTAIIESGLDIPRANTIIIDDAQNFGLAQLYQLRGRVGRSEKRAYCYLLIPGESQMTEDAKQRIQVIQRYTDLGSGFNIASHDLEIRGAGDLLGKSQSGHLNAIGVDLYFELLEDSLRALKGEEKEIEIEPEINMKLRASFPSDYLPDISERILIYRRLSSVKQEEDVSEIETEIRDRFGPLPDEVMNLLGLMRLKLYLKKLHVVRMSCGPKRTALQFAPSTPASPDKLVKLITSDKEKHYSLTPDQKLVYELPEKNWKEHLQELLSLCDKLGVEF